MIVRNFESELSRFFQSIIPLFQKTKQFDELLSSIHPAPLASTPPLKGWGAEQAIVPAAREEGRTRW